MRWFGQLDRVNRTVQQTTGIVLHEQWEGAGGAAWVHPTYPGLQSRAQFSKAAVPRSKGTPDNGFVKWDRKSEAPVPFSRTEAAQMRIGDVLGTTPKEHEVTKTTYFLVRTPPARPCNVCHNKGPSCAEAALHQGCAVASKHILLLDSPDAPQVGCSTHTDIASPRPPRVRAILPSRLDWLWSGHLLGLDILLHHGQ